MAATTPRAVYLSPCRPLRPGRAFRPSETMTRAEIVARIQELQTQLDNYVPDPLKTEEEQAAGSAPILRALTAFKERLRRLDLYR